MGNFNNNLIVKWRERFELLVRLTLGVPILLAGLQLALVGNQLSFDVTKLATWTNTEKVFALPLGIFALLAAVTSLIGLYHRSMLLNRQLEKVQEQIAISNKQFKRSDEQFKLAQEQFALAQKKEHFMLRIEHQKNVNELINQVINRLVSTIPHFKSLERVRYEYNTHRLYSILFPENDTRNFDNTGTYVNSGVFLNLLTPLMVLLTHIKNKNKPVLDIEHFSNIQNSLMSLGFYITIDEESLKDREQFVAELFCVIELYIISLEHTFNFKDDYKQVFKKIKKTLRDIHKLKITDLR
ncbi:MAG: hypothetical protein CML20_19460 [Rheinheimera sp.]|nr:hypothetical protein [Rheinheimera sp.]